LTSATREMNATSIAATLIASFTPSAAPCVAASMMFEALLSIFARTEPYVSGTSVSGSMILLSTIAAGADMTLAPSKCAANMARAAPSAIPCTSEYASPSIWT